MIKIGLIDDRRKERETVKETLTLQFMKLQADWLVIDYDPLPTIEEYQTWLVSEGIQVLIVDEKLNEQGPFSNVKVPYTGHELIEFIRTFDKSLPIFVITSWADNADLLNAAGNIDNIIDRTNFAKYSEQYVQTFIRISNKYFETFESEFLHLSILSERIAVGAANEDDVEKAKALQLKLFLPFTISPLVERETAISEFSGHIDDLAALSNKIDEFIKSNP